MKPAELSKTTELCRYHGIALQWKEAQVAGGWILVCPLLGCQYSRMPVTAVFTAGDAPKAQNGHSIPAGLKPSSGNKYTVFLGLPYDGCQQNNPRHWHVRQQAVKQYREDCCVLYRQAAIPRLRTPVTVHSTWYIVRKRGSGLYVPEDPLNALGSFKSGLDALVDAGVIDDDRWEDVVIGRTEFCRGPYREDQGPGVLLRLEENSE